MQKPRDKQFQDFMMAARCSAPRLVLSHDSVLHGFLSEIHLVGEMALWAPSISFAFHQHKEGRGGLGLDHIF